MRTVNRSAIRESLESLRHGKDRVTINLRNEAKKLDLPFDDYLQAVQNLQDEGELLIREVTKDGCYSVTFL